MVETEPFARHFGPSRKGKPSSPRKRTACAFGGRRLPDIWSRDQRLTTPFQKCVSHHPRVWAGLRRRPEGAWIKGNPFAWSMNVPLRAPSSRGSRRYPPRDRVGLSATGLYRRSLAPTPLAFRPQGMREDSNPSIGSRFNPKDAPPRKRTRCAFGVVRRGVDDGRALCVLKAPPLAVGSTRGFTLRPDCQAQPLRASLCFKVSVAALQSRASLLPLCLSTSAAE